jgi:hypothetical protein
MNIVKRPQVEEQRLTGKFGRTKGTGLRAGFFKGLLTQPSESTREEIKGRGLRAAGVLTGRLDVGR